VFTIPDTLNGIAFQNQEVVYAILFKSVSETLSELAANEKYLGAKLRVTSILHTWGSNLALHPHIHCVIPGGGLNSINQWIDSKGFKPFCRQTSDNSMLICCIWA
jgi:hypothetical protein